MMKQNKCSLVFSFIASISFTAFASDESKHVNDFVPTKIALSRSHSCVLSSKGQVKCWGSNNNGELGTAASTSHGLEPGTMGQNLPLVNFGTNLYAKDLCVGYKSTCIATLDGRVKCWGLNNLGQLGQERDDFEIGRKVNDMGDNLPFTNLGSGFKVKSVHCGGATNCALSETGELKCWGDGSYGALGSNISPKTSIGRVKGEMGDKLPKVALPAPVEHVSVGSDSTCAATQSAVYCWGANGKGQVGIGSTVNTIFLPADSTKAVKVKLEDDGVATVIESISSGIDHSCALYHLANSVTKQKVKCWGDNFAGALGIGSTVYNIGRLPSDMGSKLPETLLALNQIIQLEVHEYSACVLAKNGDMKCWGKNYQAQLGVGDYKPRGELAEDMGSKLPLVDLGLPIFGIASGSHSLSSCAILINHEIKCWGYGREGALGYEDILSRGGESNDMGENLPYVRYK